MAGTDAKVGVPGTTDNMEGVAVTTTAGANLFREGVVVSDPVTADARARVLNAAPGSSEYGQVVRLAGTASVTQATTPWITNDPGLPDALGQTTMAGATSVTIASDQTAVPVNQAGIKGSTAGVAATVAVTNAAAGVQIAPANANRVKAIIRNADALNSVYIYFGAGPTTVANSPYELGPGDTMEEMNYTGEIRGIASVATVNVARQEVLT